MNKIKISPMHIKGISHEFGYTDFGISANFSEISKDYFKSDPNESQMSITYDYLIETDDDEYESDHIN